MPPAQQTVRVATSPATQQLDPNFDRRTDLPDCLERKRLAMPPLDKRDRGAGDAGEVRHVLLPKASAAPDRPNQRPKPQVLHGWSLADSA